MYYEDKIDFCERHARSIAHEYIELNKITTFNSTNKIKQDYFVCFNEYWITSIEYLADNRGRASILSNLLGEISILVRDNLKKEGELK